MKRMAAIAAVFWFLLLWAPAAYAADDPPPVEVSFEATDSGFTYSVSGIEDVEAIASADPGAVMAEATVSQALIGNRVEEENISRHTLISDSLNDNRGILSVNQEAGNLNNQANVRALVIGETGPQFQYLDAWRSAFRVDNTLISVGGERENRIEGSLGNTQGIVGINQSSGNMNQQANVLALAFGNVTGPEFSALADSELGEVSADNTLIQGASGSRKDVITDSFTDFRGGVVQVSQSSGDLNVVGNSAVVSFTVIEAKAP